MCRRCPRHCTEKGWQTFMILQVVNTSVLVISKQISTVAMESILMIMESNCCHINRPIRSDSGLIHAKLIISLQTNRIFR